MIKPKDPNVFNAMAVGLLNRNRKRFFSSPFAAFDDIAPAYIDNDPCSPWSAL